MSQDWWEPVLTDAVWIASVRADYPEDCAGLEDEEVRERYADGQKYQTTWDHLGDAREEYEPLADAFLALRAENERLREALTTINLMCADGYYGPYAFTYAMEAKRIASEALAPPPEAEKNGGNDGK